MQDRPTARSTRLLVEELDGELLVYDQDADCAHALSDDVARVWQLCDGKADAASIARDLQLSGDDVERALEELGTCGLLSGQSASSDPEYSRRGAVKKMAKYGATAASVPLIYSLMVEPAAAANSTSCHNKSCVGTTILGNASDAKAAADAVCAGSNQCRNTSTCAGSFGLAIPPIVSIYSGTCSF
ncbi:MAG TPA: PqqD family protein [Solirubrobacteraceae bacterium]|jgi:hypothetical protein|nr:PqqD family protein [Solirubrobacteraceae bacterium]